MLDPTMHHSPYEETDVHCAPYALPGDSSPCSQEPASGPFPVRISRCFGDSAPLTAPKVCCRSEALCNTTQDTLRLVPGPSRVVLISSPDQIVTFSKAFAVLLNSVSTQRRRGRRIVGRRNVNCEVSPSFFHGAPTDSFNVSAVFRVSTIRLHWGYECDDVSSDAFAGLPAQSQSWETIPYQLPATLSYPPYLEDVFITCSPVGHSAWLCLRVASVT